MNYYWYESSGRIVQAAFDADSEEALSSTFSEQYAVLATLTVLRLIDDGYVHAGGIVLKPPRPTPFSVWDYRLRAWVDPRTLLDLRDQRKAEIKTRRDAVEFGGFTYNSWVFDSDPKSQTRIIGTVVLANAAIAAGQPFSVTWKLKDNSSVELDAPTMVAVGQALFQHVGTAHATKTALDALIDASADPQSVNWPA